MRPTLFFFLLATACCAAPAKTPGEAMTLAQMLGFSASDKLLIINADDAGMSHGTNQAVIKAMTEGLVSSATIMAPCPWFSEVATYAAQHPEADFGVHLTHTSEWKYYRWSPLTSPQATPGLRGGDGYMYHEVDELYRHSTAMEAYFEAKAQIEKAMKAGVPVSHIDSHMGAMMYNIQYALLYIRLAKEYDLPLRIPSRETLRQYKAETVIPLLDGFGLLYPDYLIYDLKTPKGQSRREAWLGVVRDLKPGVTEIYIHPALPCEETKAITGSWPRRAEEFSLFTEDAGMRKAIKDNNVKIIGYRKLLELQRDKKRPPRKH